MKLTVRNNTVLFHDIFFSQPSPHRLRLRLQCQYRGRSWKILLGYLPTNAMRRQQTLQRKRSEYREAIRQHYDIDDNSRTLQEQETLRQVLVDVPRTAPEVPLFRNEKIKRSLARLLYIWAMRHPASSYVQGINDLATPLFAVFLGDYYDGEDVLDGSVMVVLPEERLDEVRVVDVLILLPCGLFLIALIFRPVLYYTIQYKEKIVYAFLSILPNLQFLFHIKKHPFLLL